MDTISSGATRVPPETAAEYGSPRPLLVGTRFTALLVFTQMPNILAYTIALPLLAGIAHDLAHNSADAYLVKLVAGILGPAMAIGALLAGWLSSRYDRRPVLVVAGLIYLAAAVAPAFASNLEGIVITRFVAGLCASVMMTTGMTMVGDYLPEERRAGTLGMLNAFNMVVSLISTPLAGVVGNAGWRWPFFLYLLAAPVLLLALPTALPAALKTPASETSQRPRGRLGGIPLGLLLMGFAAGTILSVPGIYISFHLAGIGLGKTSTVGFLMMLNALVAAATSTLFGRIWRRSPKLLICLAGSSMAIGLCLLAFVSSVAIAIFSMLLMGVGMGLLVPAPITAVVDTVPQARRANAVGLVQSVSTAAPIVSISLLEPLLPTIGTRGVMLGIAVLSMGLCAVYALKRSSR